MDLTLAIAVTVMMLALTGLGAFAVSMPYIHVVLKDLMTLINNYMTLRLSQNDPSVTDLIDSKASKEIRFLTHIKGQGQRILGMMHDNHWLEARTKIESIVSGVIPALVREKLDQAESAEFSDTAQEVVSEIDEKIKSWQKLLDQIERTLRQHHADTSDVEITPETILSDIEAVSSLAKATASEIREATNPGATAARRAQAVLKQ